LKIEVKKHPNFKEEHKKYNKHILAYGASIVLGSALIYLIDECFPMVMFKYGDSIIIITVSAILLYGCSVFFLGSFSLYNVKCPVCTNDTKTKSFRESVPSNYSAFCMHCNVIWDLDVDSRG